MTELREYLPYGVLLVLILRDLVVELGLLRVLREALQRAQDHLPTAPTPTPVVQPPPIPAPKPPPPAAVIDQGLVNAVKKFEGFQAHAYGDIKQYSIGYGTKATSPEEVITQPEAEKRLMAELALADQYVEKFAPNTPVGVKQALTSLTYNAGPRWQAQSLGTLIKEGKYEEAKTTFLAYNHADGQVNAGLTKRRQTEVEWFDNPL